MKPNIQPIDRKFQRRQRAIALITVLSVLAIMTIMAVAMLTLSMNETKSANKYADGEKASALADSAVSLVMGQIWDATTQAPGQPRTIWSSQPGAIREYGMNGAFQTGYKLYSTDTMVVAGTEATMIADVPAPDWGAQPGKWVDLNEPIIRPAVNAATANDVVFPIIDPRAYVEGQMGAGGVPTAGSLNVEGFFYQPTLPGVLPATSPLDGNARLPMPVQWLYLLKDGTVGWVTAGGGGNTYQFQSSAAGSAPSEANPIVGRIAFWTDDESCKVNINTAGEPTPWSLPVTFHQRDYQFAMFPPTRFEFQRYPGHPATVALSSVLFPYADFDTYLRTPGQIANIVALKERIYDVMPKINNGGSQSGTIPFWTQADPKYAGALQLQRVDIAQSVNERLYASVDEMVFSQTVQGGFRRSQNSVAGALPLFGLDGRSFVENGVQNQVIQENRAMDRLRFFLTAHSRAPEINIHGGPRVAIWPIASEALGPQWRTGFDNVISFCSSLGGPANSYIFRRQDADSMTVDASLARNAQLLNYLYTLMSQPYPSGGGGSASFVDKYGPRNVAQILVQIFDYVRSTNLYDGALAPTRQELLREGGLYSFVKDARNSLNTREKFLKRDAALTAQRTFTDDRASQRRIMNDDSGKERSNEILTNTAMPGHGQVVPTQTSIGGQRVQGFGRFLTLSEIGLHFICTADGNPDNGSWRIPIESSPGVFTQPANPPAPPWRSSAVTATGSLYDPYSPDCIYSGGRTSTRLSATRIPSSGGTTKVETWQQAGGRGSNFFPAQPARWFSNYAPLRRARVPLYGTSPTATSGPKSQNQHPGYDPANWNYTLEDATPLRPGERRVQGLIGLELTVPASGYVGIFPEFCIRVSGLSRFQLANAAEGQGRLFKGGDSLVYRGGASAFNLTHARAVGGSISPFNMSEGRRARKVRQMPDDEGRAGTQNLGGPDDSGRGKSYNYSTFFDLMTDYFTVNGSEMRITGGTLNVELYAGMDPTDSTRLVQTFQIPWPSQVTVPTPELVVLGLPAEQWQDANGAVRSVNRVEAPHWWAFHRDGALNRDVPMAANDPRRNRHGGRFFTLSGHNETRRFLPRDHELIWGKRGTPNPNDPNERYRILTDLLMEQPADTGPVGGEDYRYVSPLVQRPYGQDTVLSMVVKHGDIRLTACLPRVGPEHWTTHPNFTKMDYMAHTFVRHYSDNEAGFTTGQTSDAQRLTPYAPYQNNVRPDLAATPESAAARFYGDFDNGVGPLRDGAWINKADEGNSGVADDDSRFGAGATEVRRIATAYFDDMWISSESGESFMSPNRMISSAVMFGSLPASVHAGGSSGVTPWRTLLFRPYTPPTMSGGQATHPGAPNYGGGASQPQFAGVNPADHYLLDLFWMPVVEPYAISEPLSTAGKINLNYQMVPFHNYITRSTGLHAAMKGELLTAVPTADARTYKRNPTGGPRSMTKVQAEFGDYWEYAKWSEDDSYASDRYSTDYTRTGNNPGPQRAKFWHRKVDTGRVIGGVIQGTLAQFESRFRFLPSATAPAPAAAQGLFRTASQICEVHLIPQRVAGSNPATSINTITPPPTDGSDPGAGGGRRGGGGDSEAYRASEMTAFWQARAVTGDNTKERPYANLYAKLTTQSNTFRVHYRVQAIRKARSVEPGTFDQAVDTIASDQRGSVLIERRIDPTNPGIPDYAASPGAVTTTPLDNFYKFRVLEQKRFNP